MKTKKRKIGKKIPQKKASEEKILVAWETPKQIPNLPYSICEEIEDIDWCNDFWISVCPIRHRIPEISIEIWESNGMISDLVYENALLQNVEFEWGTYSRPVHIRPIVLGRDIKAPVIKTAKITEVVFENAEDIDPVEIAKCNIIRKLSIHVEDVDIRKCAEEKNFIYKNTKFFCRTCSFDICNDCFITECSNHDVQWLGVATFNCYSPEHKTE